MHKTIDAEIIDILTYIAIRNEQTICVFILTQNITEHITLSKCYIFRVVVEFNVVYNRASLYRKILQLTVKTQRTIDFHTLNVNTIEFSISPSLTVPLMVVVAVFVSALSSKPAP